MRRRRGQANIISIVIMITIAVAIGLALWWFTVSYAAITTGEQQAKTKVEEIASYILLTIVTARRTATSTEAYFTVRWIAQQTYPFYISCFAINTTSDEVLGEATLTVLPGGAEANSSTTVPLDRVYVNMAGDWYRWSEVSPKPPSSSITVYQVTPDPETSTVALKASAPWSGRGVALKIIVWVPVSNYYYEGVSALAMP